MYQAKVTVETAAEVKAILGEDFPSQVAKIIDHIDSHCRSWIERCPFVVISSTNAAGALPQSFGHLLAALREGLRADDQQHLQRAADGRGVARQVGR